MIIRLQCFAIHVKIFLNPLEYLTILRVKSYRFVPGGSQILDKLEGQTVKAAVCKIDQVAVPYLACAIL